MGIHVKNISKQFKDFTALKDVNLEVNSGELIALLGPSGSGKTTLLRIIAGLEFPDTGSILLEGKEAHDQNVKERQVGFVFQHYALFKHMTVFDNVAFGLRVREKEHRPSEEKIRRKVMELLSLVHLEAFYDRYPSQLSGGQRQRVALARALAVEPKVLLLDEPFGALDAKVRKELRRWMRRLHDDIHITSIFVTHDQEEAMEVSDRVVVMSNGKIEQVGTPEQVYHYPANAFVYDFLGNYNEFQGWKDEEGNVHLAELDLFEAPEEPQDPVFPQNRGWLGRYPEIASIARKVAPSLVKETKTVQPAQKKKFVFDTSRGKSVKIFARPHEVYIEREPQAGFEFIRAKVVHINPAGALVKLELIRRNGQLIQVEVPKSIMDKYEVKKNDLLYVRPKTMKVFE